MKLYPAVSEASADHVPIGLRQVSRRTTGFTHNSKRRNKWIGVAEDSFDEFCRRIITDTEPFLDQIGNCEHEIWKSKPKGISLQVARASTDQVIREVAGGLDDSWRIFDARPDQKMRGFVRLASDGIRKHETELVFALKNGDQQREKPRWKLW